MDRHQDRLEILIQTRARSIAINLGQNHDGVNDVPTWSSARAERCLERNPFEAGVQVAEMEIKPPRTGCKNRALVTLRLANGLPSSMDHECESRHHAYSHPSAMIPQSVFTYLLTDASAAGCFPSTCAHARVIRPYISIFVEDWDLEFSVDGLGKSVYSQASSPVIQKTRIQAVAVLSHS